ncbi:MAG TPA: conjugal transfer protein, partial [Solirubrobacteraceae bacterium]|nr:conjugal transfer protein [Solirubrobacteraceae bacterium]
LAACSAAAVLALVGLKALLAPTPAPLPAPAITATAPPVVGAFAEAFTRAYFTVDPADRERWSQAVGTFAPSGTLVLTPPSERAVRVTWTSVVNSATTAARNVVVTVVADTSVGVLHLAVPVARDRDGALRVSAPPALVGGPPVTQDAGPRVEREVDDEALRAVAGRVVKNYLARERDDLAADLAPGAVVPLPDLRLRVTSVEAVTWSGHRVAVAVSARGREGLRLELRYELAVIRRGGRWLVRTVHTNPVANGGSR